MPNSCSAVRATTPGKPNKPTTKTVNILIGIANPIKLNAKSTIHSPTTPPKMWILPFKNTPDFPKEDLTTSTIKTINKTKKNNVMDISPLPCLFNLMQGLDKSEQSLFFSFALALVLYSPFRNICP